MLSLVAFGLSFISLVRGVTVYGQIPLGQTQTVTTTPSGTSTGAVAAVTTYAAYNDTVLTPPNITNLAPGNAFSVGVPSDVATASTQGLQLSIPHNGVGFWGFSIEMSVVNQVLGKNSSFLQVPFLNLMANLVERSGGVMVRVGGNTQERATLVDSISDGRVISKETLDPTRTTRTPGVIYTTDLFYMMNNVSALTNVKWFLGIPFNDSSNWRLQIVEQGQPILGDNLLGFQAANEPDFFVRNQMRDSYNEWDYVGEIGSLSDAIDTNPNIQKKDGILIAPNLGTTDWTLQNIFDAGLIDKYKDRLYSLSVEHYPEDNCFVQFGSGTFHDPQETFPQYLTHQSGQGLALRYTDGTAMAASINKPFIMFETNTASCGGFQGISDTYGAALWALDYGFQMAFANFTHALLHVGGQNVFYNPFTPPPTNQSTFNEWTVGSTYYSTLVIAEAFGKTNTSRIVDLLANDNNEHTPAYAIYENDKLSKYALFNYIDDPTGASDMTVSITVPGGTVPSSVKVKYLSSESVSVKNITWAGQTFGPRFTVDGRLKGDLDIQTVNCDTSSNSCPVKVKAPGFALVFLSDSDAALQEGQATQTFSTSTNTKLQNTATLPSEVVATSNGHSGKDREHLAGTSRHSTTNKAEKVYPFSAVVLFSGIMGGVLVLFSLSD
ncbi:glycoside hydrolase family 79 protein [Cyathus striatus]|nr:glycoside hydrolase family 79 protein [Cyathus striatus]